METFKMGNFNIQELPTVKYTVQVISMKCIEMSYSMSKTFEKFIRDIKQGDLILLEYPPVVISKSGIGGGIMSFSIKITNLNSEESISVKAGVSEDFWYNLDEFRIIE